MSAVNGGTNVAGMVLHFTRDFRELLVKDYRDLCPRKTFPSP